MWTQDEALPGSLLRWLHIGSLFWGILIEKIEELTVSRVQREDRFPWNRNGTTETWVNPG
jgi:hypothetical protein